jgi:hypothetical protein
LELNEAVKLAVDECIRNDILSECTETLVKSGIERKDVMPQIANKGRNWFLAYVNKEAGL